MVHIQEISSGNEAVEEVPAQHELSSENETAEAKSESTGPDYLFMIPSRVDRISDLPDSLIQHILSFLPTTKQAIRTQLLSKRWRHQWARVPLLILHSDGNFVFFLEFLDQTLSLHDTKKLEIFEVIYGESAMDFDLEERVRYALDRRVQELVFHLFQNPYDDTVMPQFLYTEPQGFVKLDLAGCLFDFKKAPSWPNLKELKLNCSFKRREAQLFVDLLKGCPSLESLQLIEPFFSENDVLSFPSLKKLVLVDGGTFGGRDDINISCPDLQSLYVMISADCPLLAPVLPGQVLCHNLMRLSITIYDLPGVEFPTLGVEGMIDASPFLKRLELDNLNTSPLLQLSSNTLNHLILGKLPLTTDIQLSCPQPHQLDLFAFRAASSLEMEILRQLSHVEVIGIGRRFVEHGGQLTPLDCRELTVEGSHFEHMLPGIISTVNSCLKLEKLTVKLLPSEVISHANNLNEACYDWVAPNLKMIKLVGLREELVFDFIKFVLPKSPALEMINLVVDKSDISFVVQASNKLISYQRANPQVRFKLG